MVLVFDDIFHEGRWLFILLPLIIRYPLAIILNLVALVCYICGGLVQEFGYVLQTHESVAGR